MGFSQKEFYETTPRTFANVVKGKTKLIEKEKAQARERWEMHRELVINMIRPYLKKQDAQKSLQELYPLDWDKNQFKKKKKTPEEIKKFWENIDKRTPKK